MSAFLHRKYQALTPYAPGEQPQDKKYIKLNTNESPFFPPPGVVGTLTAAAARALRLYPDPQAKALKKAIADFHGVATENVFVANGSDDILNFAFMAFGEHGCTYPDITYGFYPVFAALNGVKSTVIPLMEDFSVKADDYLGIGKTVFLANPNAPTGLALAACEIERIAAENPENVVVVDEAYVDFGAESALPLVQKYNNLLIVRTFSKSRQLAGARLGYAIACKSLIDDLELLRYSTNPYNINRLTMEMGVKSMEDTAYFAGCCEKIIQNRALCARKLQEIGFTMPNSLANFLFVKHEKLSGREIYLRLKDKGVLVRYFDHERLKDYNRITIGSRGQIYALVSAMREILREAEG